MKFVRFITVQPLSIVQAFHFKPFTFYLGGVHPKFFPFYQKDVAPLLTEEGQLPTVLALLPKDVEGLPTGEGQLPTVLALLPKDVEGLPTGEGQLPTVLALLPKDVEGLPTGEGQLPTVPETRHSLDSRRYNKSCELKENGSNILAFSMIITLPSMPPSIKRMGLCSRCSYSCRVWRQIPQGAMG